MGATLHALQVLQQVTLKLTALNSKIEQKKHSVRTHQKKLAARESELAARHQAIMQRQSTLAQMELEFKAKEAQIGRFRELLNKSRTNKEYAAVLTQINTSKADNSKLEDRILETMNELEVLKRREDQLKSGIEDERRSLENARKVAQAFEHDSQTEFRALKRERAGAASAVPAGTLSVFERVAERHDGQALARVVQPHPKRQEFICDGCNMSVTLEQYVVLQAGNEIQVCHSCGRVLFLDERAT